MNFLRLQSENIPYNQAKAVIVPVPYNGLSYGAEAILQGPEAILQASQMLSDYDVESDTDLGNLNLQTLDPITCPDQALAETVSSKIGPYFRENKLVAAIGGSHLISQGLVAAAVRQFTDLSVIQLGAHPHLFDAFTGQADVMTPIREMCPVAHIGIRSMSRMEKQNLSPDNLVFARDLYNNGLNAAIDTLDLLSENVYVAINLDILDPACMHAVIRPEPGGLDWYTLNNLIRMIAREKTIIGFDVTGIVPQAGEIDGPLLAAKLIYKTLIWCLRTNR